MSEQVHVAQVVESIEGESSYAGFPCAIVRLAGCDLDCSYCDTSWAKKEGTPTEIGTLVDRASQAGMHHVLVTGGEPLGQEATPKLLRDLCDAGNLVLLETSGACSTEAVDPRVKIVLDVKCPGSGMAERMDWKNLERLRPHDEVKLVLCDREDYEYAKEVMEREALADKALVHLSPVLGQLEPVELAGWIMADKLRARLAVQLHKLAWPDLW